MAAGYFGEKCLHPCISVSSDNAAGGVAGRVLGRRRAMTMPQPVVNRRAALRGCLRVGCFAVTINRGRIWGWIGGEVQPGIYHNGGNLYRPRRDFDRNGARDRPRSSGATSAPDQRIDRPPHYPNGLHRLLLLEVTHSPCWAAPMSGWRILARV